MKTALTAKYIRQLLAQDKDYAVWDAQVSGLGVRVKPSGHKAFILQTRIEGRERKATLGWFPELSVKDARTAFTEKREALVKDEGGKLRHLDSPRMDEFINGVWMEQKFTQLKPSGQRSTRSYINSRVMPGFGAFYLDEIDKPIVAKWFDEYSKTYPGGANRSLEILISILEFAIVCGHIKENPGKGIRKNPKKTHKRFLSTEEITRLSKLLDKVEKESPDYKQGADIVRLLLLTGCRHREITHLRWS